MGANYRLIHDPNPTNDPDKKTLHPRVVPYGTVGIDELLKCGKEISSFSPADVKGVLQLLSDLMADRLECGYNVELDGIGFFSVSLTSRKAEDKKEIRSESVVFNNVNFRCGKELKKKLQYMKVSRLNEVQISQFTENERLERMIHYLHNEPFMSSTDYMTLNHCSRYTALKDLKNFVALNILTHKGYRSGRVYLLKA